MLQALQEPTHVELYYRIFYHMLHGVPVPEPALEQGLKERLGRLPYSKRSRGLIEDWWPTRRRT